MQVICGCWEKQSSTGSGFNKIKSRANGCLPQYPRFRGFANIGWRFFFCMQVIRPDEHDITDG